MTIFLPSPVLGLLQGVAAVRDTVFVRPILPARTGIEELFFYAAGLTSILALFLAITLIAVLLWMRRWAMLVGGRLDTLLQEIRPMLKQARETNESVRKAAEIVLDEVTLARDGLHQTGARVRQTVGDLAERVDDFNDLLAKLHARADAVMTVAGTAVEGIAWGAEKLRERKQKHLKKKKNRK